MIMDVSMLWLIAAANVLLVASLIFSLMQTSRRARVERIRSETERIQFQENEQRLRSLLERRQALQHAVAKVLAGASTVEEAVPDLLQAIVVNLGWHVGLFWRVQDDRRTIICTHGWSVDTTGMQDFLRRSGQEARIAGSDLPSHCWTRGEPLWVEDEVRFSAGQKPRSRIARISHSDIPSLAGSLQFKHQLLRHSAEPGRSG